MKEIHIQDIDTEKYLNRYLNPKFSNKEAELNKQKEDYNEDIQRIENDNNLTENQKDKLKESAKERYNTWINRINHVTYWKPPTDREKEIILNTIKHEIKWRQQHLDFILDISPLPKHNVINDYLNNLLSEDIKEFKPIHNDVISGRVIQDFYKVARYMGFLRFAQNLDNELHKNENPNFAKIRLPKPIKTLSKTQFTELVKALLCSNVLEYETETQAVEVLANHFNIDISKAEFDRTLQKIKGRNIGSETLFLSKLINAFTEWVENKE